MNAAQVRAKRAVPRGQGSAPPYPTHRFAGACKERAEVGLPGHCERCAEVGHVEAHPDLGCSDVRCDKAHGPDDE
ncbi:MAG: hypothetical protein HOY79_33860 [Streptomyces sp.]|nr:hypothetical protein [Streptomyces sp.]